jgi:CheY-like chemotaxis protein/DNA-binding MarR family transcriptional regulator
MDTDGPQVLIVDDDRDVLEELQEGLVSLGYPTIAAFTAQEALELVQRHISLRIVVTDLMMPQIDGIELLQKLAARRRSRPLSAIVMTGNAALDRAVAALRLNAVDFLQKPVSAEEVANSIRHALALIEDGSGAGSGTGGEKAPTSPPDYLRALVAARSDREAIFDAGLFSDPAWEMLLDLAFAEATGRAISVTSLCLASGASTTTALRRIDDLQEAGLLERVPDPADRRRIIVMMTLKGREKMELFVQRQAKRLGS